MSSYIKEINGKRYFARDDYFGHREYGYFLVEEGENWENVDFSKKKAYRYTELIS